VKTVIDVMRTTASYGGERLEIYMMVVIPSNVSSWRSSRRYSRLPIGSNDLSQLTLGLDRDRPGGPHLRKRNEAVLTLVRDVITKARKLGKKIGTAARRPATTRVRLFIVDGGIDRCRSTPTRHQDHVDTSRRENLGI
jgi:pyruvate,water dikinase